ncbi:hypothetical protein GCM10009759_04240 [Kitasatospora saccharophila]|uniref:Uncharacterized protein n=1 Tax=Kitasatospora saccharophila TaxID=407973 RepID=A0ABN2W6C4_9ACTN
MDTTAFTKTLPGGRAVSVIPFITAFGAVTYTVTDSTGGTVVHGWLEEAAERGVPADRVPPGCTHLIAGTVPVWLTPSEVEAVTALGNTALAAFGESEQGRILAKWRQDQQDLAAKESAKTAVLRTPEGKALAAERARLVAAAAGILDADAAQRQRADEDDDGTAPGQYYRVQMPANEAAHRVAIAVLDRFDAQHPQIKAALDADRTAATRRFLEYD